MIILAIKYKNSVSFWKTTDARNKIKNNEEGEATRQNILNQVVKLQRFCQNKNIYQLHY